MSQGLDLYDDEDIKWHQKPLEATLLAVFPANINNAITIKLIYVLTEVLRLQSSPVRKLLKSIGFFLLTTTNSVISVRVPPSKSTSINCFMPLTNLVTLIYNQFILLWWVASRHTRAVPSPFSNILTTLLIHLHKGWYDLVYHQYLTVITLMYQPALPLLLSYWPSSISTTYDESAKDWYIHYTLNCSWNKLSPSNY